MPTRTWLRILLTTTVAVGGLFGTALSVSWGQHSHGGDGHASGHQAAEACSAEFDKVVADGRGFGMAFAADQNGYPGPMHILELKDRLKLTDDQEARTRGPL